VFDDLFETLASFNLNKSLRLAVCYNSLSVVKYFVEKCGINVNVRDENNMHLLTLASRLGHLEVVKHLVRTGKCNANLQGRTLCDAAGHGDLEMVRYFVQVGKANANAEAFVERALTNARQQGHDQIVAYLLKQQNVTNCCICLDEMNEEIQLWVCPCCAHSMHYKCMENWILEWRNHSCPMCRGQVTL
jgi:ankyrin repeat protein